MPLAAWPVRRPGDWLAWVNEPHTAAELDAMERSLTKGRPFGTPPWQQMMTRRLGLQSSYRPPGRPKKNRTESKPN